MLIGAIKNELEKLYYKKRIHVVSSIVIFFAILMMTISYFDHSDIQTSNWRDPLEKQVQEININLQNIKNKDSDEYKNLINQRSKLNFYLKENINPELPGAVGAATESTSGMFIKIILPILIVILAADVITNESANGTLKSLLVSPIGRKNILISKWIAVSLISITTMLFSDVLTYLTSIPFDGIGNWGDHVVIGVETFKSIPAWEYMLVGLVLNSFVIVTLVSVCILISVLFKTVTTSLSLSMAIVIFGSLLANFQAKIDALKYLFVLNFDLLSYLTGESIIQNSSLFVATVSMLLTALFTLYVSLVIFTKKDMLI